MVDWTHLNGVDWIIIVVLSLSILLSLWRGFVREALSLAGWVAAFVIANLFVDEMASLLAEWIVNIAGRYVASYAILFVGTLVVAGVLAKLAGLLVKVTGLTVLDRVLGTVFGFARGVILVLVAVFVLRQLAPPGDLQWLHQSQLMPHLDMLAYWVQTLFSQFNAGAQAISA
ncbi:MAG: CvpA family protein [Gammaproteobacteria bacterium]|nr:MAG: CvpA family protein [Gammaproteobacteria bacterium]RLA61651.1 MAG: CvpA family protein [Gammaproteobacteria bacterium]